jgi:hypothetical protein
MVREHGPAVSIDKYSLEVGTPGIKSVGPLAFGPEGILFVADNVGAAIFAIDVGDTDVSRESAPINIDKLDTPLAAFLGCSRDNFLIRDMAVHPASQNVYLSVMRGSGEAAVPVIIKVGAAGVLSEVPLEDVPFSQTLIEDAAAEDDPRIVSRDKLRTVTVTDMHYVEGLLLVAGASNEEFSSTLRRIPFPFKGGTLANSLEIFHVSHGRYETAAPIRAFVPYGGSASVLATYTCTPVVHFSLSDLQAGTQAKGRTVADLGAHNRPLDMVSYRRDGEEYLLICNDRHPLMKIACQDIDRQEPLTQPSEPVGVPRQTLPHPGVKRMVNWNGSHVLMMQEDDSEHIHLRSYGTATL